jgi:predicted RNA-binding protein with PUA-like domain
MRAMKKGDLVLFYHSNEGLEVVGVAKVSKEYYPDPTAEDDTWSAVNLKPVKKLKNPVSLATIKSEPRLAQIQLLRLNRLSVTALTPEEFDVILQLGETIIK